jgi:hypothetical protein
MFRSPPYRTVEEERVGYDGHLFSQSPLNLLSHFPIYTFHLELPQDLTYLSLRLFYYANRTLRPVTERIPDNPMRRYLIQKEN